MAPAYPLLLARNYIPMNETRGAAGIELKVKAGRLKSVIFSPTFAQTAKG